MGRALPVLMGFLAVAVVGCGGADASPTPSRHAIEEMRTAAVQLLFQDANASALPRAYDVEVLRRRMRRYVATRWLDRRVEETAASIHDLGGRRFFQSWTQGITVGRWERARREGSSATIRYLGYDTICPSAGPPDLPMQRVTVRMVREQRQWRLADYEARWLNGAGPLGVSGALTIRALEERIVFRNPPPRRWKYRGPAGLKPCR